MQMSWNLVRRPSLSSCAPCKCVSGGLNGAYWPLNGKWAGSGEREGEEVSRGQSWRVKRSRQGSVVNGSCCISWWPPGLKRLFCETHWEIIETEFNRFRANIEWRRSWGEKFASVRRCLISVQPPLHLPIRRLCYCLIFSPAHLSAQPLLAFAVSYLGWELRRGRWCHRCYFGQGWAHWRQPQRGCHPSVREQVAGLPTGLALPEPIHITSGERIWAALW